MLKQRRTSELGVTIIIYSLVSIAMLLALYPVYFVLIASISSPDAVGNGKVFLFPREITFRGYYKLLEDGRIWIGYRNTIFYTIFGTLISLFVTLTAAFALSRKDFKPRNFFMKVFVVTMFIRGGLIPTYLLIQSLGLDNTIWVMLIPFSLSVHNLIITRVFYQSSIPQELLEASELDGCSDIKYFIKIVLPLSKALIAVIALYYAVGQWNQYFNALIYLRDKRYQTLQLVLRSILIQNQALEGSSSDAYFAQENVFELIKYAVIVVCTIPIITVYPFLQKYFTKGVMLGSIKG